ENVVGDTNAENTGSSLYSRIGTTHMSMSYLRMRPGRTLSSRSCSQCCWRVACSRRVPNGRAGSWAIARLAARATTTRAGASCARPRTNHRIVMGMQKDSVTIARRPTTSSAIGAADSALRFRLLAEDQAALAPRGSQCLLQLADFFIGPAGGAETATDLGLPDGHLERAKRKGSATLSKANDVLPQQLDHFLVWEVRHLVEGRMRPVDAIRQDRRGGLADGATFSFEADRFHATI